MRILLFIFLTFSISTFIQNEAFAKKKKSVFKFETISKKQYKKLGRLERSYYKRKMGQILVNYERRANKRRKFASIDTKKFNLNFLISKAYAQSSNTCPVGGVSIPLTEGRCKVSQTENFNKGCAKKPRFDSFKCGEAYGNVCAYFDEGSYEISSSCLQTSLARVNLIFQALKHF